MPSHKIQWTNSSKKNKPPLLANPHQNSPMDMVQDNDMSNSPKIQPLMGNRFQEFEEEPFHDMYSNSFPGKKVPSLKRRNQAHIITTQKIPPLSQVCFGILFL